MFNLEQAIADWRQKMLAAGIENPVPLEELELHLREEMERQVRNRKDAERAFAAAVEQIGQAGPLTKEFAKINPHKSMNIIIKIFLGITAIIFGIVTVFPAKAGLQLLLGTPDPLISIIMLGTSVATVGVCILLHTLATRLRLPKGRRTLSPVT